MLSGLFWVSLLDLAGIGLGGLGVEGSLGSVRGLPDQKLICFFSFYPEHGIS